MSEPEEVTVQADAVNAISPHNKAMYEAGKSLLVESVSVGREFCKFMTTTALSAVPIYLALLKLVLPKDYVLKSSGELSLLIAPLAFLVSTIVFVLGYFPQRGRLSLDVPAEIEQERGRTILQRQRYAALGFIVFMCGVLYGAWQIVHALGVQR